MKFNKRNSFDLTHERKFSMDMGKLVPCMVEEVLPGDTFKCSSDIVLRLSPLVAPVMHSVNVFTHFFFVPSRILWSEWDSFITGGQDGRAAPAYPVIPDSTLYTPLQAGAGTLWDYLGLPDVGSGVKRPEVSALPFRAYAMIYNEWYRDQNLQPKVGCSLASGSDTVTNWQLLNRNWEKDYFTSALPWEQRGDAVGISVAGEANLIPNGKDISFAGVGTGGSTVERKFAFDIGGSPAGRIYGTPSSTGSSQGSMKGFESGYKADLATALATPINDIRKAFQLQKWFEKSARGGSRLVETILEHFGVRVPDSRLQRPEFLGGGRSPIVISEVLQTSETSTESPQGNMTGHGFSAQRSHEFYKSFTEHGYIIGIVSVLPRTAYQQGIPRHWSRRSKIDYYWPVFAHLGEQGILNKEIYFRHSDPDGVFGFTGRADEYRRRESTVHGDFRTTLRHWHMGRIFDNAPTLSSQFVTADPTKRINAVLNEHNCWMHMLHRVRALRSMPVRSNPGLVDHG